MQFSSVALLSSGFVLGAQAGPTDNDSSSEQSFNISDVEILGINVYYYNKIIKPTLPLEMKLLECGQGVTKCVGGHEYLKCVNGKWVVAKCRNEQYHCRKVSMSNQCMRY